MLRHFNPKADLPKAVIDPYLPAVTHWPLNTRVDDSPTESLRRQPLTKFVQLFLTHRGALRLLVNDVSRTAAGNLEPTSAAAKDRN